MTTTQLHSKKLELRSCAGSKSACGVTKTPDGKDLCEWSGLEIRLNAFRRSSIPQKNQFNSIHPSHLYGIRAKDMTIFQKY